MKTSGRPAAETVEAKERRGDLRFPVDTEAVLSILPEGAASSVVVRVVDVSASGLCFESHRTYPPGTGVRLQIKTGVATGEIRYCQPASPAGFRCGVDVITYR